MFFCKNTSFIVIKQVVEYLFSHNPPHNHPNFSHNPLHKHPNFSHNRTIEARFFTLIDPISFTTKTENSQLNTLNNNKMMLP